MNVLFHISLVLVFILVECGESNPVAVLRSSLSLIPTFRPLQPCHSCGLSRCHPRLTLTDYPVRWLTIQCSIRGFRVILQSFYLVYLRSQAASIAGHQPSYQSHHITFWCSEYDAILFRVAKTYTVHYQNHRHLVLHALCLPLLYFVPLTAR